MSAQHVPELPLNISTRPRATTECKSDNTRNRNVGLSNFVIIEQLSCQKKEQQQKGQGLIGYRLKLYFTDKLHGTCGQMVSQNLLRTLERKQVLLDENFLMNVKI